MFSIIIFNNIYLKRPNIFFFFLKECVSSAVFHVTFRLQTFYFWAVVVLGRTLKYHNVQTHATQKFPA